MFIRLLLVFTIVPIVELYVLLQTGRIIGIGPTIALILLTGIAGAWLARTQGFEILSRIRLEMAEGRLPAEGLLDGAMVLAGGLLLLTPGLCTDLFGFVLLVPMTRQALKKLIRHRLEIMLREGNLTIRRF